MDQILIIISSLILGVISGWHLREYIAAWRVRQLLNEYEKTTEKAQENLIPIKLEKHSDTYYVYGKDGKFLAQANSQEDLEDTLIEKFPGKQFAATPENLREMGFIKNVDK